VYVLVTGLPGSGKSTLAPPLAAMLGMPMLARDSIKEALWDALGAGDLVWSRKLGAASAEVFWRLAGETRGAVLDNFFHRAFTHRIEALAGPIVEVHCDCPPDLARERYLSRRRHPCHFDLTYGAGMFDEWVRMDARPLAIPGSRVRSVDTTCEVDISAVVEWIRGQT
jgi:predicted kinase